MPSSVALISIFETESLIECGIASLDGQQAPAALLSLLPQVIMESWNHWNHECTSINFFF